MPRSTWSSRVSSLLSCRVREMWLEARCRGRESFLFKSGGKRKGLKRKRRDKDNGSMVEYDEVVTQAAQWHRVIGKRG